MKYILTFAIAFFLFTISCQAQWTTSGTNIYNSNSGNVGIGTTSPSSLLHLQSTSVPLITLTSTGVIAWKLGNFDQSTDNGFTIGFNAVKMLYIGNSGKIGIGTAAPSNLLHVMSNVGGNDILQLNNTDATDGRTTILFNSGKGQAWEFGENLAGSTGLFGLRDRTSSGFPIRFAVNTSGYMGIGTTSPVTLLNVAVPSAKTTVAGNVVSFLSTNDASNAYGLRTMIYGGAAITNRYVTLQTTDYQLVDGGSLFLQPANGYVGIGTTDTKGYMFAVNGSAIATSMTVKLNANWPDYVFKPDYNLPSLQEIKTYIDQNKHLPEMPSAAEVEKNGLNLGEANKLLTKKVEELTLYLLEKDRQVQEDRIRIKKLEDEMQLLLNQKTN